MKSAITPYITIKKKKIESASRYLCNLEEIIYASKAQLNYPPDQDLQNENCYVILTYGFMYLFNKENKELKLKEQICTLGCEEIQFVDEDEIDKRSSISFITNSDQNILTILNGANMEIFYQYLYYSIFIISSGLYSQFRLPELNPKIPMKFFSIQFCVYKRSLYFIHLDMKQQIIPNSEIEGINYFDDPDIYYKGQLLINSKFHPGNFADYYGKAISFESRLLVIVFSNFNEEFSTLLESILINSRYTQQIKFTDYEKISPTFNFEKVTQTNIKKFQFTNSNFSIIESFMKGIQNSKCQIKRIKLAAIKMNQTDLVNFFYNLNKIPSFSSLVSFSLADVCSDQISEFPMNVFGQFLQNHEKIEVISFSNVNVDGSTVLWEIITKAKTVYEIHLNRLNFEQPLTQDLRLPRTLVLVDFSHSKFKNTTLRPVLELFTSSGSEASGLKVNMGYIEPRDNTFINAYKGLAQTNCLSNICEVNWSGNHLSPDLFKFFQTQKQLKFISLMDLNIQKQGPFFQMFAQVVKLSGFKGLEIGSDSLEPDVVIPFILSLKDREELEYFRFHCQNGQDRIGVAIAELIETLPNLKEVAVEMKSLSPEVYIRIGTAVVSNASIMACAIAKCEVAKENQYFQQIVSLTKKILKLKAPSTIEQRTADSINCKKKEALNVEKAFDQDNFDDEEEKD